MDNLLEILGTNIREMRKSKGWTQDELGRTAGVTRGTVQSYERGKKRLRHESVIRIAEALAVPSWSLFIPRDLNGSDASDETANPTSPGTPFDLEAILTSNRVTCGGNPLTNRQRKLLLRLIETAFALGSTPQAAGIKLDQAGLSAEFWSEISRYIERLLESSR